jgi:NRPS condensation-like uncharacterized protein
MVARIKGPITKALLRTAISKVQQRHPILRTRIVKDHQGDPWFTTEGAGEISVEVVPHESNDDWIGLVQESSQMPFEFDTRPPIRIFLAQAPDTSDLVIFCHHIICDGLSLAYLARDLMIFLGDPARVVDPLPEPVPISRKNIPNGVSLSPAVQFLIRRMNQRWQDEKMVFDQTDYAELNRAYWMVYPHQVLAVELSVAQTSALVQRCRQEGVTVNSALTAAFAGAQVTVQGAKPYHSKLAVAANLRDRMPAPAGEVMGFYAGLASPRFRYGANRSFWGNARRLHREVRRLLTNKGLFQELLTWCYLDPTLMEAISFKMLGSVAPEQSSRRKKLCAFAARDDVVRSILKREKMDSLDRIDTGTAVTNLGRLDFPAKYGALELDRLIIKPGVAFPLANLNLVLGAVSCTGKLSLVIEFIETNVTVATMKRIREEAVRLLLEE